MNIENFKEGLGGEGKRNTCLELVGQGAEPFIPSNLLRIQRHALPLAHPPNVSGSMVHVTAHVSRVTAGLVTAPVLCCRNRDAQLH